MSQKTLSAQELLENSENYDFELEEWYINVLELVKLNDQLASGKLGFSVDLEGEDFVPFEENQHVQYELSTITGAELEASNHAGLETSTHVLVHFEGMNSFELPATHNLFIGYFEPTN